MTTVASSSPWARETAGGVRRLVSDLEDWRIVTMHQLQHYLRTYRFLGLLALVFVVSALTLTFQVSAGVATVQVQQFYSSAVYLSSFLTNVGLWIILAAAFFGGDALSVDFSTGAGYYMLVLPIRRSVLLVGRFTAAASVTFAIVGVYYAFAIAGGMYFFNGPLSIPWVEVAQSLGLAAVFSLATLSVAFCVSAFTRSPVAGVLITILALYVGFTTFEAVAQLAGLEPWFSVNYAGGAIASLLNPNFAHEQVVPLGRSQSYIVWAATVPEGLAIMAGYIAAFLPLGALLYQRKESTG